MPKLHTWRITFGDGTTEVVEAHSSEVNGMILAFEIMDEENRVVNLRLYFSLFHVKKWHRVTR